MKDFIFRNKKLISNSLWLYVFQIFNLVIPLLTLPYITRVLGKETYGIFSSSLNIITYFNVFVAYGFDLIGAKKASEIEDEVELNTLYSSIFTIKFILMIVSFGLMTLLSIVFQIPTSNYVLMFLLFLVVFGTMLQQVWLFHGLQKTKYLTIFNVIYKTISVAMIFLFIKEQTHIELYALFYSSTFLLTGISSFLVTRYIFKVKIIKITKENLKENLIDGLPTFFTSFSASLYSGMGITMLTIFHSEGVVGGYSAVYKIPTILVSLFMPILQALFPYMSQKYKESKEIGYKTLIRVMKLIMPFVLLAFILMVLSSKLMVIFLFGEEYVEYHLLLIPLGMWLLFGILNNFLGIQGLVASGNQKSYSKAFLVGFITISILSPVLGFYFQAIGVALAVMIAEITLAIACLYYFYKEVKDV